MPTGKRLLGILSLAILLAWSVTVPSFSRTTAHSRPFGESLCSASSGDFTVTGHERQICVWKEGRHRPVNRFAAAGEIIGIAVSRNLCIAITESGLIYTSTNLDEWEMTDFNAEYGNDYGQISLLCVQVSSTSAFLCGLDTDGNPVAFTSALGHVWSQRSLDYSTKNGYEKLRSIPCRIDNDEERDRFIIVCNNGCSLIVPGCSHCNTFIQGSDADSLSILP